METFPYTNKQINAIVKTRTIEKEASENCDTNTTISTDVTNNSNDTPDHPIVVSVLNVTENVGDNDQNIVSDTAKSSCDPCKLCRYCSQHICMATTVSLCAAITVLIIINLVLGFDPFLIILMFSLIFLLMTLLTG